MYTSHPTSVNPRTNLEYMKFQYNTSYSDPLTSAQHVNTIVKRVKAMYG